MEKNSIAVVSSCKQEMQRVLDIINEFSYDELFVIKQGLLLVIYGQHARERSVVIDIGTHNWPFYVQVSREGQDISVKWAIISKQTGREARNHWMFSANEHRAATSVNWDDELTASEQIMACGAMRRLFAGRDLIQHRMIENATFEDLMGREK